MIKALGEANGSVERALDAGVGRMIAIGGSGAANEFALSMATGFPGVISAAIGFDRDCAGRDPCTPDLERIFHAGHTGGIHPVAVGEIGLDFHYHPETSERQCALLNVQLAIARGNRVPVIVHSREADDATLSLLAQHAAELPAGTSRIGVIHCFTGDKLFAQKLLDLGFHLSFSGIVTFRNAESLREVARMVPARRLLIETDSPFLAPIPHRGNPNEPSYLPDVAAVLAEVRGCSIEAIASVTTENAMALFDI